MAKLLLIILLVVFGKLSAQDSVVYKLKILTGKIIDYSPVGALLRDDKGEVHYCINNYKRLTFSDTLVVFSRYSFPFKKRIIIDTLFLENGNEVLFTKSHKNGTRGIILKEDELLFSYPSRGDDYFVIKQSDIQRITYYRERILLSGKARYLISHNDSSQSEIVYLKNGTFFKTDFAYIKHGKLFLEDDIVESSLRIPKKQLEKIIYADSLTTYFDSSSSDMPKVYLGTKDVKHAKFYPYWMKKNYVGINITNFLMCDLNISYYRAVLKNKVDIGVGINFPIYSTSQEISNLSALNNQYYKFTKNYEFVLSTEYYLCHSDFFKNLSIGLVYRHTNYNYTYVDNSDGYYKNDKYDFIENRTDRIANSGFVTMGCFIPVRKRFFFKANLGLGWEEYNDPYQIQKGNERKGSSIAAYANFMAGIKF